MDTKKFYNDLSFQTNEYMLKVLDYKTPKEMMDLELKIVN
jgi:hypothetical protein